MQLGTVPPTFGGNLWTLYAEHILSLFYSEDADSRLSRTVEYYSQDFTAIIIITSLRNSIMETENLHNLNGNGRIILKINLK
jgi:hypothetical protein